VDLSSWEFPENPFKRVYDELDELQAQYHRLEHITKGASAALGGCGPGNILREIAKRTDRKELDQVKRELDQVRTDNAHLHAQMASMVEELGRRARKSGNITRSRRWYSPGSGNSLDIRAKS
jgi:hypothetical protein